MIRLLTRSALLLAGAVATPLVVLHAQTPAGGAPTSPAVAQPAVAQPAVAQPAVAPHPDLSGTWELNTGASNFGPQGAPTKGMMTVIQHGDTLRTTGTVTTAMGEIKNTMHHTIGATTTDTIGPAGQEFPFTSTSRWEGTTFVIDGKAMSQGMEIPVVSRYTLSPDGKTLTVNQVITAPNGEMTQRIVYNKTP